MKTSTSTKAWGVLTTLTAFSPIYSHAADTVAVTRQVSYAGLDINTSDGAHALYRRLRHAASSLCSPSRDEYRGPSWVYRECIEEAMAKAVVDAKRPLLAQMFVGDFGSEVAAQLGVSTGTRVAQQ